MKIDYEITVDVSNESEEVKNKVQDAFNSLGFKWQYIWHGYIPKSIKCYSNTYDSGALSYFLLGSEEYREPTHTIEELFKLAGMENEVKLKTNLKPFDLEKALAGDPVVTRDGRAVSQIALFNCNDLFPVVAVVDLNLKRFTVEGTCYVDGEPHNGDLFMKPKTHIVNGFEVPAPETDAPPYGARYYIPNLSVDDFYVPTSWGRGGDDLGIKILSRNILFLDREDAIANAKAMLGINPY